MIGTVDEFAIDPAGGVYLGTVGDHRIVKVEPSGTMSMIAGTGTKGFSGDNGPATKAQLWNPQGLALDGAANLYIADTYNHRIRKIDSVGTITTIAGNGTQGSAGDGGPAALAQFRYPVDVAIDRGGALYVAEAVIVGPLYYRLLVTGDPITPPYCRALVDTAMRTAPQAFKGEQ